MTKNIQHKKLANGVTDRFKISLIDGDGNEISSNFKDFKGFACCFIFLTYIYYGSRRQA